MIREPWTLSRKLTVVLVANVVAVLAIALALGVTIVNSEKARAENCVRVIEALDVFTDALVGASEVVPDPARVEAFRASWFEPLGECS